jgi:hypothetical protein
MAESALTFGVCFAIIGILLGDKRPWLTGIAIALAVNAKQSALPLFAVGLFAVCWLPQNELLTKRFWANIGQYLGVFALLTLILNPMMWEDPVGVVIKSYRARQDFLNKQIDVSETLVPEQVMINPMQRSAVMIANLYILHPSFYEVGNYVKETEMSEMEYINIPGHNLFRGVFGGGILLIMTLFGMATATLKFPREHPTSRRNIVLLLLGTFLQAIALIIAVPLPYQRYVIPMVPFISLWIGFGLSQIIYKATTQPFPRLGGMKQV